MQLSLGNYNLQWQIIQALFCKIYENLTANFDKIIQFAFIAADNRQDIKKKTKQKRAENSTRFA